MKLPTGRSTCIAVVLLLSAAPLLRGAEGEPVFVERFGAERLPARWRLDSDLEPPGLRWHRQGEAPGFHFKAVASDKYIKTHDYAWAEWNVGTQPFELSWDLHLQRGHKQRWFYPGVAVAMTSAPPGQMDKDDIAVTIGVHMGGIAASGRRDGFFDLYTEGRAAYANFRDRTLSRLITGRSGGTASVTWPVGDPSGNRLAFRIRRAADDKVQFAVFWPDIRWPNRPTEAVGGPFWTGEWQMSEEAAKVPLRYVSVKRVPVEAVHVSYGFTMQGVVSNIQGQVLSGQAALRLDGIEPVGAVLEGGARMRVRGSGFGPETQVRIGSKAAREVRVVSDKELLVTLPELPAGTRCDVTVTRGDGLRSRLREEGIAYGRVLERITPRNAATAGGEEVTIVGAGFQKGMSVRIGGIEAKIVEIPDASHVKVHMPPGSPGAAEVTARIGERAFAGSPRFGYRAVPPHEAFADEPIPVIFNTDLGEDIDDVWALVMLLKSPQFDVKLINTSWGKSVSRAKSVARILEIAGRTDIPIGLGAGGRGGGHRMQGWIRDYSLKNYPGTVHDDGAKAIIDTVKAGKRPVTVITVGPPDTLAAAVRRDPNIAPRVNYVAMLGNLRKGPRGSRRARAEWNARAVVAATRRVLAANWRSVALAPVDVTGGMTLTGERFARIRDSEDKLLAALIENYRLWRINRRRKGEMTRSSTLHDCVAVYLACPGPSKLVKLDKVRLTVTRGGITKQDPRGDLVTAALAWRDAEAYRDLLVRRLLADVAKPSP
jgi:inosine-uridine nucleoside N-ribohydrolase